MSHTGSGAAHAPSGRSERQLWMSVLARADAAAIDAAMAGGPLLPDYKPLRGPESGLVMLRGRAGGDGAAFNLGEMTVTRCTVQTACGRIGHAYVQGRDGRQAELAAVLDAALQDPDRAPALRARVVEPLAAAQRAAREQTARQAAATRVEFFTMTNMRG